MLPFISVFEKKIPMYGLCIAVGLVVSSLISCVRAKKRELSVDDLIIFIACIVGMALVGAGLFYDFVTYGVEYIILAIQSGNFRMLLEQTGLVFYGGMIGGLLGMLLAQKITGCHASIYYSSVVPTVPMGHAFGRLGCFFFFFCYGIEFHGKLGVCFPYSVTGLQPDIPVLPVQLYEMVGDIFISIILFLKYRDKRDGKNALVDYILLYASMRFLLEFLRGDEIRGKWFFFSTSQWISLLLIMWIITSNLIRIKYKQRLCKK